MSKYVENHINPNETLIYKAALSPISVIMSWLFVLVAFLICALIGANAPVKLDSDAMALILGFVLGVPFFIALFITISYFNTDLAVTNKRLVGRAGIISRGTFDAPLNKIQSVTIYQNGTARLFNYGTVKISTGGDSYRIMAVKNPIAFKQVLMNQLDVYEQQKARETAFYMAQVLNSSNAYKQNSAPARPAQSQYGTGYNDNPQARG